MEKKLQVLQPKRNSIQWNFKMIYLFFFTFAWNWAAIIATMTLDVLN